MNIESATARPGDNLRLVLKLLLPSWNFFNDFDEVTQLEFCVRRDGAGESAWQPLHPPHSPHNWGRGFFNPAGNLELLEKSLIDRVATALRENPDTPPSGFASSEAGMLLARIVRGRLSESHPDRATLTFRFRLLRVDARAVRELLFESAAHPFVESSR